MMERQAVVKFVAAEICPSLYAAILFIENPSSFRVLANAF